MSVSYPHSVPQFATSNDPHFPLYVLSPDELGAWASGQGSDWAEWLKSNGFEANLGEICMLPALNGGGLAGAVVGFGTASARRRRRFGVAGIVSKLPNGSNWKIVSTLGETDLKEIALGWLLASYSFGRYRPTRPTAAPARLICPEGIDAETLLAMAEGEFLTRDLINTPASDLSPADLQQAVFDLAARFGAKATAIVGDELLSQNFPMIHAVGRAASVPPRLMDLRWGETGPQLTLVGKGVCFDTGGLDIKPSTGMLLMKKDMGGAATVLGLALMIMQLGLPIRLRVLVPSVENSISGNAMRPRDILTSRKGLTVEINNTDAEGRLILADALALAAEDKEATIISMATLTGAARVAVGPDLAPYFATDDDMAAAIEDGAATGFDPVWRLPFWDAYEPLLEPGIADLDNAPSGGFAGAITAALFLRRFAGAERYMHFDIYGHIPSDAPGRPKGGAGQGARAILFALPGILGL